MSEITRTEKFLRACIDGEPCALKPLTRVEKLLAELNETLAGGPSEVVILPETELTASEETGGQAPIMTPPFATPTIGATAKVTYNGTEYTCPIVSFAEDGMQFPVMGNTDGIGVPGGNPDAPFVVAFFHEGLEGMYGFVIPMDGATTVTISIVQEGEASGGESGNNTLIVNVTCDATEDGQTFSNITSDKTYNDILAVYKAGGTVVCRVNQLSGMFAGFVVSLPLYVYNEAQGGIIFSSRAARVCGANGVTFVSDGNISIEIFAD